MKFQYKKILFATSVMLIFGASCKRQAFVDMNVDPAVVYDVTPSDQFLAATTTFQDDFEWYYDYYRRIMFWMQISTSQNGNPSNFTNDVSNFNTRFDKIFYGRVGPRLADIPHIIEKMSPDEQAKLVYQAKIANIFMVYYAWYTTDINGSMPYTEAFQARYGGTFTPKYDTQEELFNQFDTQLKDAINTLKTPQSVPQTSYGNYDQFYQGDVNKWIKAANALRLKIAMRWMKRDATKAKAIVTEVLADAANQMSSNADSWVLLAKSVYTSGGNYNSDNFRAPKATVDFMNENSDPRIRLFYTKNKDGKYVGSFASPDASQDPANAALYDVEDTLSNIQPRMFNASMNTGDGINFFPIITYADYCFMRAELAATGVTSDDAATWYNLGVINSIKFYDERAKAAKLEDYVPVSQAEIDAYLLKPDVLFNPAIALDQITSQSYINFYKNPNEAWALYKRTGMPNNSTVLSLEVLKSNGAVLKIPRRAPLGEPSPSDLNYQNQKSAYDAMKQDPGFGQDFNDAFGRVWWDKL